MTDTQVKTIISAELQNFAARCRSMTKGRPGKNVTVAFSAAHMHGMYIALLDAVHETKQRLSDDGVNAKIVISDEISISFEFKGKKQVLAFVVE